MSKISIEPAQAVDWLSGLHPDWSTTTLGRIGRFHMGTTFPHAYQGSAQGDLPFVKVSDFPLADHLGVISTAKNWVDLRTAHRLGARLVPAGSILFARVGAALLLNQRCITGRTCIVDDNVRGFEPHAGDPRYWRYLMLLLDMGKITNPGPVPSVSERQVAAVRAPFPTMEEQRRIADFLDVEVALIDRLIAARQRQHESLDERSYATVSEILIPNSLAAPSRDWPWTWLPNLPENLPLVRLGYICQLQSGITVDAKRDISGDVVTRPYLRVANVQSDRVDLDSVTEITVPREVAARSTLRPGDVLMTEGGDLDKLGRGTTWRGELPDCLHQNHVFALRPDRDRLDGDYLTFMTQTVHGRCYFESTGVKTTNLASTNSSKILNFPIPLPSVQQQKILAHQVRRSLDAVVRAKNSLNRQLNLLAERRKGMITAAVTGQLDVTVTHRTSLPDHA